MAARFNRFSLATKTTGGVIRVVFWPKHDLRSNLRVPNFRNFLGGACPQTPAPSFLTLQWPYQSKIGGSGPAFNGTNSFINNSANSDGGATVANISLSFAGTSSFSSNSALQGGAISANVNSTLTFSGNISFTNNGYNTELIH